jgi:hypothetical protein
MKNCWKYEHRNVGYILVWIEIKIQHQLEYNEWMNECFIQFDMLQQFYLLRLQKYNNWIEETLLNEELLHVSSLKWGGVDKKRFPVRTNLLKFFYALVCLSSYLLYDNLYSQRPWQMRQLVQYNGNKAL